MTRLLENTCAAGASPATSVLHRLLGHLDIVRRAIFHRIDMLGWPRGTFDRLLALGLLREIELATSIRYDGCDEGCIVSPEVVTNPKTGQLEGVFYCARSGCGGRVPVDLDDMRQWQVDADVLASMLAAHLGIKGEPQAFAHGRVTLLGTLTTDASPLDVFLVLGNCLTDTPSILQSCERFRASRDPIVLIPRHMPRPEAWPIRCSNIVPLAEHVQWPSVSGELDWSSLVAVVKSVQATGIEVGWLTVSEAAQALLDDVSGIDLHLARARVSRAASDRKFRTNGQARAARRIDRASFDAWRLRQRERDLARADAWADEGDQPE